MGDRAGRQAVAAAAGVLVGALVNVATGMLTQQWDLAWLVAAVAAVVSGGGLLAWLTYRATADPEPAPAAGVKASGDASIAAGGSVTGSSTKVTRPPAGQAPPPQPPPSPPSSGGGVRAPGLGAIAAGEDVRDSRTEVADGDSAGS